MIYLAGSMRNPHIPLLANELEKRTGQEVFCSWHAVGPEADDYWRQFELTRRPGITMKEAISGPAARNVFEFDKRYLDKADILVAALPAGRSAHMEMGYMVGQGKRSYVLLDGEPDRWDIMYNFLTGIALDMDELVEMINR